MNELIEEKMKKLLTLLLALMLMLSLAACGGGQTAESNEEVFDSRMSTSLCRTSELAGER